MELGNLIGLTEGQNYRVKICNAYLTTTRLKLLEDLCESAEKRDFL